MNPESSRIVNIIDRHNPESRVMSMVSTNLESKVTGIIDNLTRRLLLQLVQYGQKAYALP